MFQYPPEQNRSQDARCLNTSILYTKPVYNEKHLKNIMKLYNRKINPNFHNNRITKEDFWFISSSIILIDSVLRTGKNYDLQVFLKECKYVVKEKKMSEYITDDRAISSDSEREDLDEGISNEESFDEENFDKEN